MSIISSRKQVWDEFKVHIEISAVGYSVFCGVFTGSERNVELRICYAVDHHALHVKLRSRKFAGNTNSALLSKPGASLSALGREDVLWLGKLDLW